jgi:hypothetical protein
MQRAYMSRTSVPRRIVSQLSRGTNMLKKSLVIIATAAALSIPLAGVAWADKPEQPGVGDGGVPGKNGGRPPGQDLATVREIAKDLGYTNVPHFLRDGLGYRSPGDVISDAAHGELPQ